MTGLGLDVGGSAIKWAVLDGSSVVDSGSVPTPTSGPQDVVAQLAHIAGTAGSGVETVGVALPAHVDRGTGRVVLLPNIPGDWTGFPLGSRLAQQVERPVHALNDARAFGYAELRVGAARGRRNAVFATIGTGIGGAIAIGGGILSSDQDAVGELGHVMVDPEGIPCGCGGRGCLETIASAPALVAAAARGVLLGHSPALARATGGAVERLTPEILTAAAAAGDEFCSRLVARAGRALGVALGNVCALMTIDTVVVGGGATGAIDLLVPAIERELAWRASLVPGISVHRAALGGSGGAVGAALYAHDKTSHGNHDLPHTPKKEHDLALDH
ncbi:ROK family protein [Pedococcus sp. NPDC057267]|uniref:ROK family protein n=1 Tax=Pedococcus sp. NPDC057267 TaxID=3346077 RepID=UPI0036322403